MTFIDSIRDRFHKIKARELSSKDVIEDLASRFISLNANPFRILVRMALAYGKLKSFAKIQPYTKGSFFKCVEYLAKNDSNLSIKLLGTNNGCYHCVIVSDSKVEFDPNTTYEGPVNKKNYVLLTKAWQISKKNFEKLVEILGGNATKVDKIVKAVSLIASFILDSFSHETKTFKDHEIVFSDKFEITASSKQQELIKMFEFIGKAYRKSNDTWRAIAYAKAAVALTNLKPRDFSKHVKDNSWTKIDGIGQSIKDKINEYLTTGTILLYEQVKKNPPPTVAKEAVKEVSNRKVSKKIEMHRSVLAPAVSFINKQLDTYGDVTVVGSWRREKTIVGDVEFVVVGLSIDESYLILSRSKRIKILKTLWKGPKKMALFVLFDEKLSFQLEIKVATPKNKGAMLLESTGSAQFNIFMRSRAKSMGFKLNGDGLFKNGKYVAGKTEEDIFDALGLSYREPKRRI